MMDDQLFEIYQRAFTQIEKQRKRSLIQQNLAKSSRLQTTTQEYLKTANVYFEVSEETKCSECFAKIMKYPFSYLPETQTVIHTHHLH